MQTTEEIKYSPIQTTLTLTTVTDQGACVEHAGDSILRRVQISSHRVGLLLPFCELASASVSLVFFHLELLQFIFSFDLLPGLFCKEQVTNSDKNKRVILGGRS